MSGRDHNATVKVIHASNVSHRRRGSDMVKVCICIGRGQTCDQAVHEHIRAAAGVLANDDTGRLVVAVALTESVVIPSQ